MNEKFIKSLYKTVVTDGIKAYQDLLENTDCRNATDRYWISRLELYGQLSSEEKEKMLKFAELIIIDTISSVMGIFDGSSTLSGGALEFDIKINGIDTANELQDAFLEYIEEITT